MDFNGVAHPEPYIARQLAFAALLNLQEKFYFGYWHLRGPPAVQCHVGYWHKADIQSLRGDVC
jgi:hypothetical protein